MKAYLILEDGNVFTGNSIGARGEVISEIVFNTSMTGHLEMLTDPSLAGQAVVMTYPLIGNYGVCYDDMESTRVWADGCIVREISRKPSNFRSEESFETFLKKQGIPGIAGIDTRALTKILREKGTMNGMITTNEHCNLDEMIKQLKDDRRKELVHKVTSKEKKKIIPKKIEKKVALLDLGAKKSIVNSLVSKGCEVTVYPAYSKAEEIILEKPDGIMLSNGPGDPKNCSGIIPEIKKLYDSDIPIFAVCLGHQLMALANGFDTYKLKHGHRGANYPVKDLKDNKVYLSSQHHGYAVVEGSVNGKIAEPNFINVNDGTIEGLHYLGKNIFTVQFYPEVGTGSKDSKFLYDEFIHMMEVSK